MHFSTPISSGHPNPTMSHTMSHILLVPSWPSHNRFCGHPQLLRAGGRGREQGEFTKSTRMGGGGYYGLPLLASAAHDLLKSDSRSL